MVDMNTAEFEALRVEEGLVADAQLMLHELMLAKGITRAELAERLGVSRARVSQLFSSECRNFTIRLFARAVYALGEKPSVTCGWIEARGQASHARRLAEICMDPVSNIVAMWTEDGLVVPPDDLRGECRSDPRLRALLRARSEAKNDNDSMRAA